MKRTLLLSASLFLTLLCSESFAQRYLQSNFVSSITVTKDVVYAQNFQVLTGTPVLTDLKMDIYSPDGDPVGMVRPMIMYIHTGSFLPKYINGQATGDKSDSTVVEMCTQFAKRGYVAVAIDYRLGWNPAATGAAGQDIRTGTLLNAVYRAIQDTKAAVRYFKKNAATGGNVYAVDTTKIVLGGQGTGGYIAMAYATLDKTAEISLPKFLSNTTNAQYGFTAGLSYINQAALGDFEGNGGVPQLNSASTINAGYSTAVKMVFNMGGALGDSSWMEAGDAAMTAMHIVTDPFAPYTYGQVIVPTTGDFVVNVSGSFDAVHRANFLGNNSLMNAATFTDAYTIRANQVNQGNKNVFPIVIKPAMQAGCWEWWDSVYVKSLQPSAATGGNSGVVINANSKITNPDMSKAKAMAYIDTAQGYFNPRIVETMGLRAPSGVKNTASNADVKVYPNPSNGDVMLNAAGLKSYRLDIIDNMGRLVRTVNNISTENYLIERAGLSNGMYLIKISSESSVTTKKVILN